MPVQRPFPVRELKFAEGGCLASDIDPDKIPEADFMEKDGWRSDLVDEILREGWDYFAPNGVDPAQRLSAGTAILAIAEVKSPSGHSQLVCVAGGKIYKFTWATPIWTEIGTDYTTAGIRRWEIVVIGGYAIFNNGVDLPCYWKYGDATVTPLYGLREQYVASVGTIAEYDGFLMCADILEINAADMAGIMTGLDPYGTVTDPAKTSRTQYKILWGVEDDPLDFGSVVNCTAVMGSPNLTTVWHVASIVAGDTITVIGAGTAGGNLVATVVSNVATTIVMGIPAVTGIAGTPVGKSTAWSEPVGYWLLTGDASPVIKMRKLQNRIVVYRPLSIYVGVFTGDIDFPFEFERAYTGNRCPSFASCIADVAGRYHLYPGPGFFYRFALGMSEPEIDPVLFKCGRTFINNASKTYELQTYAVDNGVTNEIFFVYKTAVTTSALCYDYLNNKPSRISTYVMTCGATISKPLTGEYPDDSELWFLLGDATGVIATYGRTSRAFVTCLRYSAGAWTNELKTGYLKMDDSFNEKDVRTIVPIMGSTNPAVLALVLTSYTVEDLGKAPVSRSTVTLTSFAGRMIFPVFQRATYHQIKLSFTVPATAITQPRISGLVFEYGEVRTRSLTRIV